MTPFVVVQKISGQTPLQALEAYRFLHPELANVPMTYAGRLDPLASGKLLILIGEECKRKNEYLQLDKTYEVEVLFGIQTDTGDVLGLPKMASGFDPSQQFDPLTVNLAKYVGAFMQEYPAFSSKTVGGKALHALAKTDSLPEEMPVKAVEIYSVDLLDTFEIFAENLLETVSKMINSITGDFRQPAILAAWNENLAKQSATFPVLKIRVTCSSGTYMRALAERIGNDYKIGALALNIFRTAIGEF